MSSTYNHTILKSFYINSTRLYLYKCISILIGIYGIFLVYHSMPPKMPPFSGIWRSPSFFFLFIANFRDFSPLPTWKNWTKVRVNSSTRRTWKNQKIRGILVVWLKTPPTHDSLGCFFLDDGVLISVPTLNGSVAPGCYDRNRTPHQPLPWSKFAGQNGLRPDDMPGVIVSFASQPTPPPPRNKVVLTIGFLS